MRKAIIKPQFNRKTVLTDSHWHFIELLLRSSKKDNCQEALNYWNQAKNFYQATLNLDLVSKPLTTYYCFLNATKALLTFKQIDFDKKHGISGESQDGQVKLQNELIKLHKKGVLAGLCEYLDEPIIINQINKPLLKNSVMRTLKNDIFRQNKRYIKEGLEQTFFDKLEHYLNTRNKTEAQPEIYTLKDILYNLEFVHRAYKLTFPRSSELFIPVIKPRFVFDKNTNKAWLELQLEKEYSNKRVLNLMDEFEIDEYYQTENYYLKSIDTFDWTKNKSGGNYNNFVQFYKEYRRNFVYIYSNNELWYYKKKNIQNGLINRNSMILILAAMHRISEMSRYDPNKLTEHLESQHGWLLSEFINKSLYQFIDMISSEISGDDFRSTGFRN